MQTRNGEIDDVVSIVALHVDSWRSAYAGIMPDSFLNGPLTDDQLALWQERLSSPVRGSGLIVSHDDDGELFGFVYLLPAPDGRILLDNLHVQPGSTGSGIGTQLLRRGLTWAANEHPGREIYLEVLSANTRAIAFYERHGARRTDERMCRFPQGFELPEFEYAWPTK
ncbi:MULTISPECIES: GNAT family N-acetyltransferase [unclassified Streptosporangium]|uniref:GNAT family N-acetyltransferase n=1 Tax=unclassified Streptosporangium TaxID=2632669 RepID=UPI002E2A4C8E|nr:MULTISPECIES: GNAT family N-acetyltransferase [unclassified Streptosporangium]